MVDPVTAAAILEAIRTARALGKWAIEQYQLGQQQGAYTPEQRAAIDLEASQLDQQVQDIVAQTEKRLGVAS